MSSFEKAFPKEDIGVLTIRISEAERQVGQLALSSLQEIVSEAEPTMKAMAELSKGHALDEGKDSWTDMLHADDDDDSWEHFLAVAEKHLLPVEIGKMDELLQLCETSHGKYTDILSKHAEAKKWDSMNEALTKARTMQVCYCLVKGYAGKDNAATLRKLTKDQVGKLKRASVEPASLPKGLQIRITAAMKGKLL